MPNKEQTPSVLVARHKSLAFGPTFDGADSIFSAPVYLSALQLKKLRGRLRWPSGGGVVVQFADCLCAAWLLKLFGLQFFQKTYAGGSAGLVVVK